MRQSFSLGSQFHNDYVSVPAKHKRRLVGCGNFETSEGLRTDSRAGDVDSRNGLWLVRTSPFIHAILRTETFKGKKPIESCCAVSQLKAGSCKWSNFGLTCSRLRCNKCRTRIATSIEKHLQRILILIEPNSANFVHTSRR